MWDLLLTGCRVATMEAPGILDDAAIGIESGRLRFVGPAADLPSGTIALAARSLDGALVMPGFIDCHTHLVYAGSRDHEHALRAKGVSYEEIARAGGGIMATVRATREASEALLFQSALQRAREMAAEGVTTVEIKSGYGLDLPSELKMLRAAGQIGEHTPMRVSRTLLAAHTLPPEYQDDRAGYIRLICEGMIPVVAQQDLADAVDVFCEEIAFTAEETETIFAAAESFGLKVKLHADQRSDGNGGALAARHKALSADHLEHLNEAGIAAMAEAGTVAVLLPYAFHHLGDTHVPPIAGLRRAGVPMAIASDCNPGTSPVHSPLLVKKMACEVFGLTPFEAVQGLTLNAARALGLEHETGSLAVGKSADLAVWDIGDPSELSLRDGRLIARYVRGHADGDRA